MKYAFCPRCDKPFKSLTKVIAMALMRAHLKKAHPDYIPLYEE